MEPRYEGAFVASTAELRADLCTCGILHRVELRQLEAFEAVERMGTYQRAAAALHLSQPALWRQVQALETELGVSLFTRAGRGVRATAAGTVLVVNARDVLAQAERFRVAAAAIEAGHRGLVRVACMAPHVPRVLAPAIGRLRACAPDIEVTLLEFTPSQTHGPPDFDGLLAAGEADLAIGIPKHRANRRKLYDAQVVVGVAEDHSWRQRDAIDISELRGHRLLVAPPGWLSRTQLEAAAGAAGFELSIGVESGNASSLVALALSDAGIVVIADDAALLSGSQWPRLTVRRRVLASPVEVFWAPDRELAPAAEVVRDVIVDVAAQAVERAQ